MLNCEPASILAHQTASSRLEGLACTQRSPEATISRASHEPTAVRWKFKDSLYKAFLQQIMVAGQQANVEVHNERDFGGQYRLRFYALSDILPGEELLLSYAH